MAIGTMIIRKVLGFLFGVFERVTAFIFSLLYARRQFQLADIDNDILITPAVDIAHNIRQRQWACVDVVRAFVDRIQAVNPVLNAVVGERFAAALSEAEEIDRVLDSGSVPSRFSVEEAPLLGVPFTAKEAFAITGLPNTSGLLSRVGIVSSSDAASVSLLRRAGAIPLAVTNCSELCMWYESSNNVYGRTHNAYDLSRIVGGSSGGEACIISAAGSVVGLGSDIGGSIRMPAFFNGIFGHKPSTGIVPNQGQYPNAVDKQSEFLVTGPMARYVCDLVALFRVLAAPNISRLQLDAKVDLKTVRFYYMEDDGGHPLISDVHPHLKAAMRKVVDHIHDDLASPCQRVCVRRMCHSLEIWSAMMTTSRSPSFLRLMSGPQGDGPPFSALAELGRWAVGRSAHTLPAIGLALTEDLPRRNPGALERQCAAAAKLRAEWDEILRGDALLLYPSHPVPAPHHHRPILLPFNFAYTAIFNILGYPSTQCPLGLGPEGLPLGVQVVARAGQDHLTLAFAQHLEHVFGGWVCPSVVQAR